jgi:hypothetical protein
MNLESQQVSPAARGRSLARNWKNYIFEKRESVRTTWTFRLAVTASVLLTVWLTRGLWIPGIGRELVCDESLASGDAILVDNFDHNYLLFERTSELRGSGVAPRVLVPTRADPDSGEPNMVYAGFVGVMARIARLQNPEIIPIQEIEPISLNAAYQMRDFLQKERLRSVIVVTPGFRSRRSALVYSAVFGEAGIATHCVPVFGWQQTPETWSHTWHGIQQVVEQYAKLQYYRFYVFPRVLHRVG